MAEQGALNGKPSTKERKSTGAKSQATLATELAFLLNHAGHDVPADRMTAILAGYRDLKTMLALLRQPRTAANEPANVYSLETITRGE